MNEDDDALIQLAQRMGTDPSYIAWLIRLVLAARSQTWETLAAQLNLSPRQLALLALCRRPSTQDFTTEITQIAAHIEMDKFMLAGVLREWEMLDTFRTPGTSQIAARDGKGDGKDEDKDDSEDAPE